MTAVARFTKADMKRAVGGVVAAGLDVRKVEIDHEGKIVIVIGQISNQAKDDDEWSDLA